MTVLLTSKIRLNPAAEQREALLRTLERANACANWISTEAWSRKEFSRFGLHKALYAEARLRFALSAQVVVRLFAKVADAYKKDKRVQRRFAKRGAIAYDSRILSYREGYVTIWAEGSRIKVPYSAGQRQIEQLRHQKGESDLVYHRGKFYLAAACDVPAQPERAVKEFLGIDLGVVNIATDSDGVTYSGAEINNVRFRHRKLRAKLQQKQTRSAKRKLKKLAGKEKRFAKDVNHRIAKAVVARAQGTGRGIALEDLKGIRDRITARRNKRATLHSWSFSQLRLFVEYKAELAGVPVAAVDPRCSSRQCSQCGHTSKANRPSQAQFRCEKCAYTAHADYNAAVVLASRATSQLANRSASLTALQAA